MSKKVYYHNHHIIPKHIGGTDDPSNLVKLTIEEHSEAHRLLYEQYGRWQDKLAWLGLSGMIGKEHIWKIAHSEGIKHFYNDEKNRERVSDEIKDRWKDEVYRENIIAKIKERWEDNEYREKMSMILEDRWKDPEYRKRMDNKIKEYWKDEKNREKVSMISKEKWKDNDYRERMSIISKERWKDNDYRENQIIKMKEYWKDEEHRENQSLKLKNKWKDPEYKEKMSLIMKIRMNTPEKRKEKSYLMKKLNSDILFQEKRDRKYQCIYCDVETTQGNISKWHNNNCLNNPDVKSINRQQTSIESRLKMSNSQKGRKHSEKTKLKMSMSASKPKKKVECPFCNKVGGQGNMMRYHFNNCKMKGKNNVL